MHTQLEFKYLMNHEILITTYLIILYIALQQNNNIGTMFVVARCLLFKSQLHGACYLGHQLVLPYFSPISNYRPHKQTYNEMYTYLKSKTLLSDHCVIFSQLHSIKVISSSSVDLIVYTTVVQHICTQSWAISLSPMSDIASPETS